MAEQIKGPLGALLIHMALASEEPRDDHIRRPETAESERNPEDVADYIESLIRAASKLNAGKGKSLANMPQV